MPTEYAINAKTGPFLLSPEGDSAALLAMKLLEQPDPRPEDVLAGLRRAYTPDQAGAVLSLATLRRRAAAKFPTDRFPVERMFFTAEALEQASAWPVAALHAQHLTAHLDPALAAGQRLLDLGCGIGGDLLALAQHGPVVAYELDPVRADFARANARALGLADRVEVRNADWTAALADGSLPAADAAFADPGRRSDGRRLFRLDDLQPPIDALLRLQKRMPRLGVKVMPGVDLATVPPDCGVEFISHDKVLKEAVLWFGDAAQYPRWATVIAPNGTAYRVAGDTQPPPLGPLQAGQVLYEPDAALLRAGCLAWLCAQLHAHLFDPQIAYLVGDRFVPDPLAQAFRIQEVHTFSLKLLNARLQALGIGSVELKKRGFPTEPEALRPRLKLTPHGRAAVVFFTRRGDERLLLIGERMSWFGEKSAA